MRLLNFDKSDTLQLTDDLKEVPPYAILSHRWGSPQDEVSFDDMRNGQAQKKLGFKKLLFCGRQAQKDALDYFWVDTCCINKDNPTELQKAITSMFAWYAQSRQCYVYLNDVSYQHDSDSWKSSFQQSQWFTRGWTLQELLAPPHVSFFTSEWECVGTREQLREMIHIISGIDKEALSGKRLSDFSDEERSSIQPDRIFGVTMLPHYGEGHQNATNRLKDEIVKKHRNDLAHLDLRRDEERPRAVEQEPQPTPMSALAMLKPCRDTDTAELRARRKEIIKNLEYDNMDSRRMTIKRGHADTCGWLLEHEMYRQWRAQDDEHYEFLWIKGHPGAGKSTLMRYLDYHLADQCDPNHDILIAHYFNARGGDLEKSVEALYRSLIVQMLTATERSDRVLDQFCFSGSRLPNVSAYDHLPVAALQELFTAVQKHISDHRIYCLIDALDESDEDDVTEMISFLHGVSKRNRMLTCFASRHYPALVIPTKLQLAIDHEQGHTADIRRYIKSQLSIGQGPAVEGIEIDVMSKSKGIFMWVVLVVNILNKDFRRGNISQLRKRLQEMPQGLDQLFRQLVGEGDVPVERFLLSVQCILSAVFSMELPEYYLAMQAGTQLAYTLEGDGLASREGMQNFLVTNTKGLAEVTKPTEAILVPNTKYSSMYRRVYSLVGRVQFIHESVREWLLSIGMDVVIGQSNLELEIQGHNKLFRCCVRSLIYEHERLGRLARRANKKRWLFPAGCTNTGVRSGNYDAVMNTASLDNKSDAVLDPLTQPDPTATRVQRFYAESTQQADTYSGPNESFVNYAHHWARHHLAKCTGTRHGSCFSSSQVADALEYLLIDVWQFADERFPQASLLPATDNPYTHSIWASNPVNVLGTLLRNLDAALFCGTDEEVALALRSLAASVFPK